jgi:ABC-2 type transport system ATP-binding protein
MKALEILKLHKTYKNGFHALNNVSLDVKQGDFFGLLGPNGAGKTTLIGIVTSLVKKNAGNIHINGMNIDHHPSETKSMIGLVPQEFNFNLFVSLWHTLITQAGFYGIPYSVAKIRAKKYLTELGLWHRRKQQVRFLSGGLKRRLMIARALMHHPAVLFLDEPTAGVDIEFKRWLWDFLRLKNENGTTIVLTTHYLEEAEQLCKTIAILDQGKVVTHTDKKTLMRELQSETFIFDLMTPVDQTCNFRNFSVTIIDNMTIAVEINADQNLNDLFKLFDQHNLSIKSMRNKANRLEELFLKLTQGQTK